MEICPNCKSKNIDYGTSELYDTQISYQLVCQDCDSQFFEWYDLVFSGYTDDEGNDIEVAK